MVFDAKDGGLTKLKAKSAFGAVLRVGFDYMVSDTDGLFFSANKVFVNTSATEQCGGAWRSAGLGEDHARSADPARRLGAPVLIRGGPGEGPGRPRAQGA